MNESLQIRDVSQKPEEVRCSIPFRSLSSEYIPIFYPISKWTTKGEKTRRLGKPQSANHIMHEIRDYCREFTVVGRKKRTKRMKEIHTCEARFSCICDRGRNQGGALE
jgi:hypothetical protein